MHQFQLVSPLGRNFSLHVDANYESLTGASPWFTSAGVDGDPIVSLSGASGIRDNRSELSLGTRYYLINGSIGANIGYSEPLIVLIIGFIAYTDTITLMQYIGIVLVGIASTTIERRQLRQNTNSEV